MRRPRHLAMKFEICRHYSYKYSMSDYCRVPNLIILASNFLG